jgi:hypothetical protein
MKDDEGVGRGHFDACIPCLVDRAMGIGGDIKKCRASPTFLLNVDGCRVYSAS